MNKCQLIVPSTGKDFIRNKANYRKFFKLLPITEIVFIGPAELEAMVEELTSTETDLAISYVNENDIIEFDKVKKAIVDRLAFDGYTASGDSRPGWYYQQFLKMAWSYKCEDEYYLIWDADTLPLKPVEMWDKNGTPFFDVKVEYNPRYFRTIGHLFDGMTKVGDFSFISEHMVFKTSRMREMIERIMSTDLRGETFYEKIFSAIEILDITIGFSEFETFGTFITTLYPGEYSIRTWKSMRAAGYFFEPSELNKDDIDWLAKDYDAITFESYNQVHPQLAPLFHNPQYRKTMRAAEIYQMIQDSGIMHGDVS